MLAVPRISVVVPVYNVERYLEDCLESIAGQTFGDLEVLMVDDGSTDGSAAIAQGFADHDPRFRLISQANGGLGNARNSGAAAATGEFLSFVDSDDALPRNAYELLVGALEETGSDFATGNVHRLTPLGTRQARFLAKTFERPRLKTHVKRFRPLMADRIVPNKLWRRSFWEGHELRFPEGVVHEDIPVVLPAQFLARAVDVIAEPVYYYRIRGGDSDSDLSITQRRAELKMLEDRLAAVEHVSGFLAHSGEKRGKRLYDASVVADDLRYYLNVLDIADERYREVFIERVNAFLDGVSPSAFKQVAALERLKWHLVRRRLLPELLEVLRFQKEDLPENPPVRVGRHWYGDFPFRDDPRLRIPRSVFQLDHDFRMFSSIDDLRCVDGRLEVEGWAYIGGIGAPTADTQRVTVRAVRHGRLNKVRQRYGGVRLKVAPARRPDVTAGQQQRVSDLEWAGFRAVLDPRRLRGEGRWELYVTVQAGSARRRRWRGAIGNIRPPRSVELPVAGRHVRAAPLPGGEVAVDVRRQWVTLGESRLAETTLELSGELTVAEPEGAQVRLVRPDGSARLDLPTAVDGSRWSARVALADLPGELDSIEDVHSGEREDGVTWELVLREGGRRHRVAMADATPEAAWPRGAGEVALVRTREGDASLAVRPARATLTQAHWSDDGTLAIAGDARLPDGPVQLVLASPDDLNRRTFAGRVASGRIEGKLTPARVESLAGALPLRRGRWHLYVEGAHSAPVMVGDRLREQLPLATGLAHKPFTLGVRRDGQATLVVERDLEVDERGPYHQRRLHETAYASLRQAALRDAVVYTSFGGRQYSDNPRAIHEELVRRGAPLEHYWVVRDGMCEVPPTAVMLRDGSREHHETLATARYVVNNDHFPEWFRRRDDQTCLQTWHGTPLKRLGFDVSEARGVVRRFQREWDVRVRNWQYVLSPNRFSTPLIRQAYAVEGEMLETCFPRNDQLAGADRDAASANVRRRLGIPEGVRTVLYAPTYRDHVIDARNRYRLEQKLDIDGLRAALGDDAVVLYRKHHYIVDPVPATADGFVRDVSAYPDGTELMLAADVLVTDYSSMMFDFANTGRPILFFTYDLDVYAEEIRGFYFDFASRAPGPLLRSSDELAAALRDLDAVAAEHASRYEEFVATFCELDDGHAAERVVDRVFQEVSARTATTK